MIEWLTFVQPFGVINSSDHGHVLIHENPLVLVCHKAGSVGEVHIVTKELSLVHENTIAVRADEAISHQPCQGLRIVMQLCLIPDIFQRN